MKKSLLLMLLLATAAYGWAAPVTQRQALETARKFFNTHGITIASQAKAMQAPQSDATSSPYYVVNAGNDNGFAIISGDDRTPAILGYSLSGTVSEDNMPDNMRWWLSEYARQIEYIRAHNITVSSAATRATADRAPISPMLTTHWDQTAPYNNACPDFFINGKTVTGCVATAMAQVLYYNYQQHPDRIVSETQTDIPAYSCRTNWNGYGQIQVSAIPAGSTIDWGNMRASYTGSESDAQKTAVANLMLYCGAAVQMNYADAINGGSSASDSYVPAALTSYFGFDASTRAVNRDDGYSTSEWNDLVYNELANRRVVFYGGQSAENSGHAFVINGYQGDNFFYVNWGWSGTGDGAYLLSILNPDGTGTGAGNVDDGYNYSQDIVINAEPDHGGTAAIQARAVNFTQSSSTLSYNIVNEYTESTAFSYGFGNIASDGTITVLGNTTSTTSLPHGNYPILPMTIHLNTLPDGTYNIVPIARRIGDNDYQSLWAGRSVHVTVSNGNVTIADNDGSTALAASALTVSGNLMAGRSVTVSTSITNSGDGDYEGLLYLFASRTAEKGSAMATQATGIRAGSSSDITINWTPLLEGNYTLWLCSDANGNNVLATLSNVNIAEGNGQYAFTLNSMKADNEEATTTTDDEGRTVKTIYGNAITGSYTITANQTIPAGTEFATFIDRYNSSTGEYEDYTTTAVPSMTYSYIDSSLSPGESITIDFSFTGLPYGRYIIRPEVGTLRASYYYYMSPELWYDASQVYVLMESSASTGIDGVSTNSTDLVTVYNLQGVKVATIAADKVNTLPHGIYIINGKKIVVGSRR